MGIEAVVVLVVAVVVVEVVVMMMALAVSLNTRKHIYNGFVLITQL